MQCFVYKKLFPSLPIKIIVEPFFRCLFIRKNTKMADANCHKVLMRALDYDEAGDKVRIKNNIGKMNHQSN